ncbi:MAG: MBL fold metallo-hydrolase [Proteobacteria bacterium]|nr:MAG: MBL fold metallo-hydrolase [Pseudomonadota bacterium]QKK11679.1 MAG: MBL fold metallo-hydrolase [Pseudomonadota bacterium]
MKVYVVPVTPFEQNCSLLVCEKTKKAAIVDPGGDIERILGAVKEADATVEKILVTHGHVDHVGAVAALAARLGVPIEGPHIDDKFWIDELPQQAIQFGFGRSQSFEPSRWLEDGDTVQVGNETLEVIHCPGHTPGHVVFYHPTEKLAVVGDVLFQGSIGRTDFPRGNFDDLMHSIRQKLFPLGDEVEFLPGHGPASTFGAERENNPFVGDRVMDL